MANEIRDAFNAVYADGPAGSPAQPQKPRIRTEIGGVIQTQVNAVADVAASALQLAASGKVPPKEQVRVMATTNVNIANALENGDTLNGVTLATGDRVLLVGQTNAANNGIYVVQASGAAVRSTDMDSQQDIIGAVVFVASGTANAGTTWGCTNTGTIVVGTTLLTFVKVEDVSAFGAQIDALDDRAKVTEGKFDGLVADSGAQHVFNADDNGPDPIPVVTVYDPLSGNEYWLIAVDQLTGRLMLGSVDAAAGRDGQKYQIGYDFSAPGARQITSLNRRTGEYLILTSTGDNSEAVLTADGEHVQFVRNTSGAYSELYVSAAGGAEYPVHGTTDIVAVGDSLTEGANVDPSEQWTTLLAGHFGVQVGKVSQGGRTTRQAAAAVGAIPVHVTLSGNAIPAAGAVVVTAIDEPYLSAGPAGTTTRSASIAGIAGSLQRIWDGSSAETYTFTRSVGGASVPVAPGSLLTPSIDASWALRTLIVRLGRNDPGDIQGVLYYTRKIVGWAKPLFRRVIVCSVVNRTSEPLGSSGYDTIASLNAALEAAFAGYYVDVRPPPSPAEMTAISFTPDSTDLSDIANDCIPTGMRLDGLHENKFGHALFAMRIEAAITQRGWV